MSETELRAAATEGDRAAFDGLATTYHHQLHVHCYRMLGSIHDADDALQDTLLRAWRGLAGFTGRSSLRTWLYTIATNACLAIIERNGRRHLPVDLGPSTDQRATGETAMSWIEPYPTVDDDSEWSPAANLDRRESVELAFVAAFQHLPANQRATLLLRDVLGFSAEETATALGTTVTTVTSALARARRGLRDRQPARTQQATIRSLGESRIATIVGAYVDAWERRDAGAIVSLLTDDATFAMPPQRQWFTGCAAIARFLVEAPLTISWRLVPVVANEQLAFGCYALDGGAWTAHSIDVLTLRDDRIEQLTAFLQPSLLTQFGLPGRLPARSAPTAAEHGTTTDRDRSAAAISRRLVSERSPGRRGRS